MIYDFFQTKKYLNMSQYWVILSIKNIKSINLTNFMIWWVSKNQCSNYFRVTFIFCLSTIVFLFVAYIYAYSYIWVLICFIITYNFKTGFRSRPQYFFNYLFVFLTSWRFNHCLKIRINVIALIINFSIIYDQPIILSWSYDINFILMGW